MGKGNRSQAAPEETTATPPADETPEVSEPAVDEETGEGTTSELSATEPGPVDGLTPQEQIAGPIGGVDNYAYLDQTRVPLHERNLSAVNNPLTEASQAELNPAFTPKAVDGGPVNEKDESIGTEPSVTERIGQQLEDDPEAKEAFEQSVKEGEEQQLNAEEVTEAAQERAPEGIDAATGQPEGEATVPGAPSGMEPSSDGEAGTAGASE